MFFSPLQNVSKGEINRFHIAVHFLTHALLSQIKLFLTFFSVTGRGHISILSFGLGNQSTKHTWGYCGHTVYYALLSLTLMHKQDPHHVKTTNQGPHHRTHLVDTMYINKIWLCFAKNLIFTLTWLEQQVVPVGTPQFRPFLQVSFHISI